ncbi:hypothetical protein LCM10_11985 [Rossellomorea aquimaris]|uniref:DUF6612 family protein n=1 Tax=Rossellomorea aquimaris TaxID=189382 RepID=UPI001CD73A16|nr:DUF6612 family protein [Rossellomorea aquimaris]MCA1055707.1 hypothetical protein [Rossellomorea aquimaris]
MYELQKLSLWHTERVKDQLNYTYEIDKKTYHPLTFTIEMDFTMEIERKKVQTHQKMKGSYSKINEIDKITIPADVKESVVEFDESALQDE